MSLALCPQIMSLAPQPLGSSEKEANVTPHDNVHTAALPTILATAHQLSEDFCKWDLSCQVGGGFCMGFVLSLREEFL